MGVAPGAVARCGARRAAVRSRSPTEARRSALAALGRRGCCSCGRRGCRTIWLSPCRKSVAALRLLKHVTVCGGRAGSLRAVGGARRGARDDARARASVPSVPSVLISSVPQLLGPLSALLPRRLPSLGSASPFCKAPALAVLSFPPVVARRGDVWHIPGVGGCWGSAPPGLAGREYLMGRFLAQAASSGRRGHACLKPPATLGTWSTGPGGCESGKCKAVLDSCSCAFKYCDSELRSKREHSNANDIEQKRCNYPAVLIPLESSFWITDSLSWSAVFVFWLLRMEEKMPWRLITPGLAQGSWVDKHTELTAELMKLSGSETELELFYLDLIKQPS
ncbi:uncharacterized protein LOC135580042 isoform X3 [Columba livia]|uniref:uncharacterized protein LOC135580042 isoform X3 n=1 Tax=Columba livia TaxID=8932 RepID=UPI0031B9DCBC